MLLIEGGSYSFPSRKEFGKEVSFEGKIADFAISEFELSQAEWQAVMGLTSSFAQNVYFAFVSTTIMMYFGEF